MLDFLKKATYWAAVLCLILIIVWAASRDTESAQYDAQGYITSLQENDGATEITVLSGSDSATYSVKWFTKKDFRGEVQELQVGAFIRLNTTSRSDTTVKKCTVYSGYTLDGKLVRVKESPYPFILSTSNPLNDFRLYGLMYSGQDMPRIENGSEIMIYFQYPLISGNYNIVADSILPTGSAPGSFTDEEIAFIRSWGYTLSED